MDVTRGTLRSLALIVLPCALALPTGQARADTPPEPPQPTVEQLPQATVEELPQAAPDPLAPTGPSPESVVAPEAPGAPVTSDGGDSEVSETPQAGLEPAGGSETADGAETAGSEQRQPEQPPQQQSRPAPVPASVPPPPIGLPSSIAVPAPAGVPDPPARVRTKPAPPPRGEGKADPKSRLLSRVDTRLRRVEQSMRRVNGELDAGRTPGDRSLRELRRNVDALTPALGALERHAAPDTSVEVGIEGVKRRLRRVLAGAAALVAGLARSGVDTPESARLLTALDRLTAVASTEPVPSGPSPTGVERGTVDTSTNSGPERAYTHAGAPPAQSWSEIASQDSYPGATSGRPAREQSEAPSPQSLMRAGDSPATSDFSTLSLAAVALLVAVALSGSLASLAMTDWGRTASAPAPESDRREPRRRTRARESHSRRSQRLAGRR
jgi:hypothetical protein